MSVNLDLNNLIITLIIGLAAGFLANFLTGRRNSSLITNLFLGLAGAFIGGFLLPVLGLYPWGIVGNFITATIGALLLLLIVRLVNKRINY